MGELRQSLDGMGVVQFLLAASFLGCYALAIGGFFGPRSRGPVALLAVLSAAGFALRSDHWVHGFLLTAIAVMAMGLFIAAAWALQKLVAMLGHHDVGALRPASTPAPTGLPRDAGVPGMLEPSSAPQS